MEWLANEMDRAIEREEAKEEGRKEGIAAEKMHTALRMHGMGMDDEQIAACLDITVDTLRNWIAGCLD